MHVQTSAHRNQAARLQSATEKNSTSSNDQSDNDSSSAAISSAATLAQLGRSATLNFQYDVAQQNQNDQNVPTALLHSQLASLAQNKAEFHNTMQQAYGANYDVGVAEGLRQKALDGNFDWIPTVRYVDSDVLGGANGAYDAQSQTVLLNVDLKGSDLAAQTFVEESGHHLDTLLNDGDTAGDEGELFRRLMAGEVLSQSEVTAIQNEDDTGTIVLDGKEMEVEFWSLKKAWRKHVEKPFKKHVVEPFKEHVVEPVKKHIVDPLVGLAKDSVAITKDLLSFAIELPAAVLMGAGRLTMGLFQGGLKGGWDVLRKEVHNVSSLVGHQIRDTVLMVVHGVVNTVELMLGTVTERKLTSNEIASLKLVYGDTINYSEIRIQTGGIKDSLNFSANVVGNDVFMPDSLLDGNGGFNDKGDETFIHEIAHVWQYQNKGPEYISQSLQAQSDHGDHGVGTGEAYDWLESAEDGERFNQMNTESQAELAMFIGLALDGNRVEMDHGELQAVIRNRLDDQSFILTDEVFAIASEAHNILRGLPMEEADSQLLEELSAA